MSKVDDELTRRLRRAERPMDGDALFEAVARRRSHHERIRKLQTGMLAIAVLAATAGGFVALREAFGEDGRVVGEPPILPANGEIVFSAEGADGYAHLYAMQPDGSGRRQITDFGTNDTDPTVSPDGRTIAFVHQLEDVSPAIATIPMKGGTVIWQTPEDLAASDPAWSPDGTQLAFVGSTVDSAALYVVDVNSENVRRLPQPAELEQLPAHPTWSPDGTRIAFAALDFTRAYTSSDLGVVHRDGTGLEWLVATDDSEEEAPSWSPDGSRIAFLRTGNKGHEIWTVDREGDSPRLVARALEASLEADLAWAPDGSALLVSDGEWIFRVDPSPAGDPDGNFVQLVKGTSAGWQPVPAGSELKPPPTSERSVSPDAESGGRDIGLGFPLCNLERLEGVDWYGDGTNGAAWTGARVGDDGRCPSTFSEHLVAADLDGDGTAEPGGMGFLEHCLLCRPFAATDLSGDGVLELIVLVEASSTPSYSIYEVSMPTSERSPGIYALSVAPPGAPEANLPANEPIRFSVGGDEGFSGGLRCENYPQAPVLVYTWLFGEVDAETDLEVHSTRLQLGEDGIFHVLETEDSTVPRNAETTGLISTEPACGVDFHPAA